MKNKNLILQIAFIIIMASNFSFAQTIELSGTVISDNEKYITSRFMGFIKNVHVSEGDIVKKGQVLYSIDSTEIDNKKEQALLSVEIYKNQYLIMKRNFERYNRLLKKGLVSEFEVEQLELGKKNLEDMIKIANSRVKEVDNQYKYLKILAPNNGVIIEKSIKVGEMSIPGMRALILSDLNSLKIRAEITESHLSNVFVGKKVTIEIPSLRFKTLGKISAIIPSSNPKTHTFTIKISFKTNKKIYPGMYTKIFINIQ